jgi:Ca-activated chloride channel family protein
MHAEGTTDMASGLRVGLAQVLSHLETNGVNRVVLLSDGVPNNPAGIEPMAEAAGARGVAITSLGLGPDYDETLMGLVAQRSGGQFHYVAHSNEVAAVFRDEVMRVHNVVARNAVLRITPGPDVQLENVVGLQPSQSGSDWIVSLGEVTDNEPRDVIVRMATTARRDGASVELIDGVLEFDDASGVGGHYERHLFLGAHATSDDSQLTSGRNDDVVRAAARVQAAAATVDAIRIAREGNLAQARDELDRATQQANAAANSLHDGTLSAQADHMSRLNLALTTVAPTRQSGTGASAPMEAPSTPVAAPAAAPPEVVRTAHDEAYRVIQGH